jgi:hypothetical protein
MFGLARPFMPAGVLSARCAYIGAASRLFKLLDFCANLAIFVQVVRDKECSDRAAAARRHGIARNGDPEGRVEIRYLEVEARDGERSRKHGGGDDLARWWKCGGGGDLAR